MKYIKSKLVRVLFVCLLLNPMNTHAFWGNPADTMYLAKILMNAITQLQQLRQAVGTAKNNLALVRDINRGISQALNLMRTVYPDSELGIYKDWDNYQDALRKAEEIYGHAVDSKDAAAQGHLDRSIIEAIILYNKLSKHSKQVDTIGEQIKSQSMGASPKGAARLSAQAAGVSIHVQNQSLRTQSALLKLEAQNSAMRNKKEKDETRLYLESSKKLKDAMKSHDPQYKTPRY